MRSDARTLFGDGLFGDLDEYLLPFAKEISDGGLLLTISASGASLAATSVATAIA
jgi:hypothetical protein